MRVRKKLRVYCPDEQFPPEKRYFPELVGGPLDGWRIHYAVRVSSNEIELGLERELLEMHTETVQLGDYIDRRRILEEYEAVLMEGLPPE